MNIADKNCSGNRSAAARGKRQTAEAALRGHRFARGVKCGPALISPRMRAAERGLVARWLESIPPEFAARLPTVRVAVAEPLRNPAGEPAHAASFIPRKYLLLSPSLFSRPGELGRILYHELCHFLWPRAPKTRAAWEAHVTREIAAGTAGEMGYSAESAKTRFFEAWPRARRLGRIGAPRTGWQPARRPEWRHYLCESFCDTGAYVLLKDARRRPSRHSEWTLPPRARAARAKAWRAALSAADPPRRSSEPPDSVAGRRA